MEAVIRDLVSFGLGAVFVGGGIIVAMLRRPRFRSLILRLEVFGKPLLKP